MTASHVIGTADVTNIEAPMTFRAYILCGFAALGGILFGFDSGYVSGILDMPFLIHLYTGIPIPGPDDSAATKADFKLPAWQDSLIISILSAGTFFGALIAGDMADFFGRRTTIIMGSIIYSIGVVLQVASSTLAVMVSGRLIAGLGVGFVSAIIILYMSEIAPRMVRGAIVSGYQFFITVGILLASCVDYATQNRHDSGAYRIPVALQLLWGIILGTGLFFLPESPRFYVKKGNLEKATLVLSKLRGQAIDSQFIEQEIAEILANHEYEMSSTSQHGWLHSWLACFNGGLRSPSSNLYRTVLGTSLQMMQQWTGINFIFYFGTTFFTELGTIKNPFLTSVIINIVNIVTTPVSFYIIDRFGRRPVLIWGAIGMSTCEFIIGIIGVSAGKLARHNDSAVSAMIAFICLYISLFATTWGPCKKILFLCDARTIVDNMVKGAWVCTGEIFPLPIRSHGVALSTASNWCWNAIIAVITPYMVGSGPGDANLGSKVFFVWGSLCSLCCIYAYLLVPETKGLSLEQVDRMLEETTPRTSSNWVPHSTFAADMGLTERKTQQLQGNVEHAEDTA